MRRVGVAAEREFMGPEVCRARCERHLVAGEPRRAEPGDAEHDGEDRRRPDDQRALDALPRRAARDAMQAHALAPAVECAVVVVVLPPTDRRTLTRYAVTTHLPNSLANVSSVRRRTTSFRPVEVCASIRKMNVVATSASLPVG